MRGLQVGKKGPLHCTAHRAVPERRTWSGKPRTCFPPLNICKKMKRELQKSKTGASTGIESPCPTQLRDCMERYIRRGAVSFCAVRPYYICKKMKRKLQNHEKIRQRPPSAGGASAVCGQTAEQKGNLRQAAPYCMPAKRYMQENETETKKERGPHTSLFPCGLFPAAAKLAAKIRINRGKDVVCDPAIYYMQENETESADMAKKAAEAYPTGQTPLLRMAGEQRRLAEHAPLPRIRPKKAQRSVQPSIPENAVCAKEGACQGPEKQNEDRKKAEKSGVPWFGTRGASALSGLRGLYWTTQECIGNRAHILKAPRQ